MSRSSKGFSDDLAMLINKYRDKTKLMVIICGSSIPYIQKNVLSLSSPLSGQITCLIKTERLNFSQTLAWFDGFSDMEKILLYGVTDGVLGYMDRINHDASACENIRKLFFYPSSALLEEPENMIRQEVREPALYNAILAATASGACRMKDISSKVGEETGVCDTYLKNLISMEFIRRETPFGEKASRKTMYTVSDNMFRFWYRFVAPNRSLIARGLKDEEFESMLPGFDKYAGEIFQEICKQYMEKMVFPEGNRGEAGRWWGTDQETGVQSEIDIMSRSDDNTLLIGVCLWAGEKVGADQLEMIKWQSRLFPEKDNEIYIFARSGFTEGCLEYAAESGNINLLTFEDVIAGLA